MEIPENPKSGSDSNQDMNVRRKTMQKTPNPSRLQWIILLCGVVTIIGMKIGMHTVSHGNASRIVEIPSDIERTYYDIAVRLMEDREQVRGAAITRSNRIFNLVLIVDPSISPDYALELGMISFVR